MAWPPGHPAFGTDAAQNLGVSNGARRLSADLVLGIRLFFGQVDLPPDTHVEAAAEGPQVRLKDLVGRSGCVTIKTDGESESSRWTIAASTPYWESALVFFMTGVGLAYVTTGILRVREADLFATAFFSIWSLGLTGVIVGRAVKHGGAARVLAPNVATASMTWRPLNRRWKDMRRHF